MRDRVAPRRIVGGPRKSEGSRGMDEDTVGVRAGAAEVTLGRQFVDDGEPEAHERCEFNDIYGQAV